MTTMWVLTVVKMEQSATNPALFKHLTDQFTETAVSILWRRKRPARTTTARYLSGVKHFVSKLALGSKKCP